MVNKNWKIKENKGIWIDEVALFICPECDKEGLNSIEKENYENDGLSAFIYEDGNIAFNTDDDVWPLDVISRIYSVGLALRCGVSVEEIMNMFKDKYFYEKEV